jgi:hypothetical protein
MADDTITFHCPSCNVRLTVPASLAGVTGPCPTCRAEIQAPTSQAAAPPPVKPEPRHLPQRDTHEEVVAKPMPATLENAGAAASGETSPRPRTEPPSGNWLLRFLLLFAFLIAVAAVVYCVLTFVLNRQPPKLEPVFPKNSPPASDAAAPSLPISAPEPPATGPGSAAARTRSAAAMNALEKFLAARTLTERQPYIESRTPLTELASSCLGKPLPAASDIETTAQQSNPVEQVTDIFYNLNFDAGDNRKNPQTILVRIRGNSEPKVVADPFLDSFGGRLAAYAAKPAEKGGIFEVVVRPLAACNDENVPNREKKLTLKLLPQDNQPEIARAYCGDQSKIAGMLHDGSYSLSYGKAAPCTVLLRWNFEERPETPYLEAVDIQRLDWNP